MWHLPKKTYDSDIYEGDLMKKTPSNNATFGINNKIKQDYVQEYYEIDTSASTTDFAYDNFQMQSPPDTPEVKISVYPSRGETFIPPNLLYSNNRYLPTMNINDPRNIMSYRPVLVLNNDTPSNSINIADYPASGLVQ